MIKVTPLPLFHATLLLLASGSPALAQPGLYSKDSLTIWGPASWRVSNIPDELTNVVAIESGGDYCLALKANGTLVAWGANLYGVTTIPGAARNIVAISAAKNHCLALKSDGTVVRWGISGYGLYPLPDGLENITAIATGFDHCMAMTASGAVRVWGGRSSGNGLETPFVEMIPPSLDNVKGIAAGDATCAVLGYANPEDFDYVWRRGSVFGNVVIWGSNPARRNIPYEYFGPVDCIALAVGYNYLVGLLPNKTVVVESMTGGLQEDSRLAPPAGLTGVTAVSMSKSWGSVLDAIALKSDGTVVVWGNDDRANFFKDGAATVNGTGTNDVGVIASGGEFHMALRQPLMPANVNSIAGRSFVLPVPPRLAMASYTATGLPPGLRINATTGIISGIPAVNGLWNATIQTKNITKTLSFPIRFLIDSPAYGAWGDAYWTPETTATASNEDRDGDGLQNGVEYALGTNPVLPDPSIFQQIQQDGNGHLSMLLDVPSSRAGLAQWKAQFSATPDFTTAVEAAAITEPGAATGFIRYRFTDPTPGAAASRFGRLKAVLP